MSTSQRVFSMDTSKYTSTLGFSGILCGSLMVALDATGLSPSLPTIENDLQATTIEVYWAGASYTLGAATFLPLFAAASNAIGRRSVSITALLLFLVGTIICGTAPNIAALLAGRVLQGIGGGGIIAMLYVVIADLFVMRWRPKALAINGLVWLLGTAIGPVMGGGFSTHVTWRWIFWIALPVNGIALCLVAVFLNLTKDNTKRISSEKAANSRLQLSGLNWRNLDYIGAAWVVTSLCAFLVPITWAGTTYAWNSYHTLVPLILGVFGLASFLVYESLVPKNPVLPLSILNDRTVAISFFHTFSIGILQFGLIFYLPLYYQIVKGYSPLISGVAMLPGTLLGAPATTVTGILISKFGKYKLTIFVGWLIMILGCGLLVLLERSTSPVQWIFLNVPAAIGIGTLFAATAISAQAPVKDEHMAIASGLIASFRAVGQTIGIAVSNTIVLNVLKLKLQHAKSARLSQNASLIAKNLASPKLLSSFADGETSERAELVDAIAGSLHGVWWLLFGIACFNMVLTPFIDDVSLDRAPMGDESQGNNASGEEGERERPQD